MSKLYAYKQTICIYEPGDRVYKSTMHSGHKVIHLSDIDVPIFFMESKDQPYVRAPEYDIEIKE